MHAQRALRTRHMAITVQLMRPGPRSVALRLVLVGACPPGPGLPRLPIEKGIAAQVVGLKLGAVRGRLRLASPLAHMWQAPYAAMRFMAGAQHGPDCGRRKTTRPRFWKRKHRKPSNKSLLNADGRYAISFTQGYSQ